VSVQVRVCGTGDVAKGEVIAVKVGELDLAVVHADDDSFYAIRDECSHANIALSEGEIDGCTLECWLHGSRFDLRSGHPTSLPANRPVPVYPVKIDGDDVFVAVKE
jgi:3-phenylpropionate/trans-cinnamate dioxygenase ferredoxin subunit